MLSNDFYTVLKHDAIPGKVTATVSINKDHKILEGHFPGLPVVPGVCMVQMVKELVEMTQRKKYLLSEADNVKFLSVINPLDTPEVEMTILLSDTEKDVISIQASMFAGSVTFFKLKANLKQVAGYK